MSLARLSQVMGIRPSEGRRTAYAGLYHLAFVAAVVLVKSASNALVVSRFRAETLPILYIASALVTGLAAWGSGTVARRLFAKALPRQGLILGAALLAGLAVALEAKLPAAVIVVYLFGEAFATLISIRFWGAASELFDQRASRRIFGILGAAGMAGAILAGLSAQLLGARIGAVGLLPLASALMLICVAASTSLRRAVRQAPEDPKASRADRRKPNKDARSYLWRNPYPRALATLMLLLAILTALADYIFRVQAGARYSEAELAALFGALNLWMGIVAVVFQLTASGRILERFGVFRYLLVTPVASAGTALASFVIPGMGPAFALRLVESSGSLSLNPAAFQLLYGPIPDTLRPQVRSLIDGLVKKIGFAAGGLLLLLVGSRASLEVLVGAVVGVVALYVAVLTASRRFYIRAIEDRLAPAASRGASHLASAEARAALRAGLASQSPMGVLTSLAILRDDQRFDPLPHLPHLLLHPDQRVRLAAVRLIADRMITQALPQLERLFVEDESQIQYEAALALGRLAPTKAAERLLPWLERSESPLSGAAIAALAPREGVGGPARRALAARLDRRDAPVEERIETARALGRMGPSLHASALAAFLADRDPEVRRIACAAAGRTMEPSLIPALCLLLADRLSRAPARNALAAYGDRVVGPLSHMMDDRSRPVSLRLEVPRVLRKIGTAAAARALLFSNIQEHAYLRYRIATNLSRLHDEHPEIVVDAQRLQEATFRRLRTYEYLLPLYRDLEAALPPRSLLVRAMGDRMQQNLEVIFRLLQLRHPEGQLLAAWRRFTTGDARERAYALELLEHLLDEEMRRPLLPVLDRYHRLPEPWGGVPAQVERAPARVLEIAVSDDEILRALAIYTAGRAWPDNPPLPPGAGEESALDASVIERVFLLEAADIFARCDIDDLVALATIGKEASYREGQTIFVEGEEADALYVVLEGRVRFDRFGSEVFTVGVRDAFGETSLLDSAPRPVTATAAAPEVRLLAIDRHDFLDLVADRPELLRGIFEAVTRHMRRLIDVAAGAEPAAAGEAAPARKAS